jgi:lambda family phage portal protein
MKKSSPKPRISVPRGGVIDYTRIQASYEGASTSKARLGMKGIGTGGPNSSLGQVPILRSRVRHALRNNPYAITAQNTYKDNVIGTGIMPQWPTPELQALWDSWAKKCDADGQESFGGLQALLAGAEFSDGEAICRRRWRKAQDNLPVPFQLEVMEGDHLSAAKNNPSKLLFWGIQKNVVNKRTGYYLHPHHPLDFGQSLSNSPVLVKAEDVIHYYTQIRPKQDRGIPHLSTILLRLYEIDEMQDATLVRQKAGQLFGAFITRNPDDDFEDSDDGVDDPIVGKDIGEDDDGTHLTEMRAGALHYLEEGESVHFSNPNDVGRNYIEWLKTELRASAKAIGITYEQMTGDLTGVSFSSIRAGLNEFRKRIERVQYHLAIHKFCHRVAEWFLEAVYLDDILPLPGYMKSPNQFLPIWQTPKLYSVNPLQDAATDLIEVRGGFSTRQQKQMERANEPAATNKQLMVEQGVESEDQLILDSNPAAVNKSGALQQGFDLLNTSE